MGKVKEMTATWRASWPYEIRKKQVWNYGRATEDVWYELWERYEGWRGKLKYRQVCEMCYTEAGTMKSPLTGDLAWAKRTAKRFNLKVPK